MKNKRKAIFKNKFFLKLFGIPSIIWLMLTLIAMIPDEMETDPLTWIDFIKLNVVIMLFWFAVSYLISFVKANSDNNIDVNISTKTKKMKSNNKCLYTCESILDALEYKKMAKYFPKRVYWVFVFRGLFLNLIFSAIIAIASKNLVGTLVSFTILQIFLMILYKVRLEHYSEQVFNTRKKQGIIDTNFEIEFYDDYFIRKGETITLTVKYSEISKCVETDTNFYLEYPKQNVVIIIQKNSCDLKLISFIRKTFENTENHIGDNSNFKGVKKYHHPKFIKNGMILLFIITIASLWGALFSVSLVNKVVPQHGFNFIKNMWVFWCWLPVPISSIILGYKYNNAGFKCTKNIVAGFIIGILLFIYGLFCLFPTFTEDYSKINNYKEIIDAKLPKNGVLEIQNWGTYFDDDKTKYTIINAYYDKENINELVESIENNENWILSQNIKSELKIFVPSQIRTDDDAYYSIFNKTTSQYNTLPESSGEYEIYAMKYDKSDRHLEIHKFNFIFNK